MPAGEVLKSGPGPRAAAWSVLTATFLANLGVQYLSPVLPTVAKQLHLTPVQLGAIISSYSFAALAATLPAGYLADRLGVRKVLSGSLVLFGAAGVLAGLAPNYPLLLGSRVAQGVGFAAIMPVTVAALADLSTDRKELSRWQAYRVSISSGAEFVLPIVGGFIVTLAGWRATFVVFALPLGLSLWTWRSLRPTGRYATATAGRHHRYGAELMAGCRQAPILSVFGAGLGRWWLKYALFSYLPLYLSVRLHAQPSVIGIVVAVQGLLSAAVASQAGRVGAGRRAAVVLAVALFAMGAWLAALPAVPSLWWAASAAAGFGIADGLVGPATNTFVSILPAPRIRTSVIALSGTLRNLGKAVSPVVVGVVIAATGYGVGLPVAGLMGLAAPAYLLPLIARPDPAEPEPAEPAAPENLATAPGS
ncbi:MAG: MFS transporter [Mycobacteriales bacterium]